MSCFFKGHCLPFLVFVSVSLYWAEMLTFLSVLSPYVRMLGVLHIWLADCDWFKGRGLRSIVCLSDRNHPSAFGGCPCFLGQSWLFYSRTQIICLVTVCDRIEGWSETQDLAWAGHYMKWSPMAYPAPELKHKFGQDFRTKFHLNGMQREAGRKGWLEYASSRHWTSYVACFIRDHTHTHTPRGEHCCAS